MEPCNILPRHVFFATITLSMGLASRWRPHHIYSYIYMCVYIYALIYMHLYICTVFLYNFNSNSNTCQVYSQSTVNHHPDLLPTHTATASVVPIHIAGSFRFEAFRATRPETIARNRQCASWYLVCSHAFYSNNFSNHVVCNDLNTLSKKALFGGHVTGECPYRYLKLSETKVPNWNTHQKKSRLVDEH